MKNETMAKLIAIGVFAVIYLIWVLINDAGWNGGYCSCGGKWVYQQAIGHRYSTNYIYECDKCGRMKEFYIKHTPVWEEN